MFGKFLSFKTKDTAKLSAAIETFRLEKKFFINPVNGTETIVAAGDEGLFSFIDKKLMRPRLDLPKEKQELAVIKVRGAKNFSMAFQAALTTPVSFSTTPADLEGAVLSESQIVDFCRNVLQYASHKKWLAAFITKRSSSLSVILVERLEGGGLGIVERPIKEPYKERADLCMLFVLPIWPE